uniref:Uncharacterized protein n=1 Tax=Cebus imitator TaxID=2715852 RepID=A0A2K5QQ96_CEBIM
MVEADNHSTHLLASETTSLEEQLQGCGEVIAWFPPAIIAHNLLLTYLMMTSLLLLSGLNQHGVLSKYIGMAKREMNKILKQKEKNE